MAREKRDKRSISEAIAISNQWPKVKVSGKKKKRGIDDAIKSFAALAAIGST